MSAAVLFAIASLALVDCGSSQRDVPEEDTSETGDPIIGGSVDTTHTAVVEVLFGAKGFCSGTVVQVKNGVGYVLTAAHCCNKQPPTAISLNGVVEDVTCFKVDPSFAKGAYTRGADATGNVHDFCMLTFDAPTGTAVIPVATPGGDTGLSSPAVVESVGYGYTTKKKKKIPRLARVRMETITDVVQSSISPTAFDVERFPGLGITCHGDSGGPALLPSTAPQAQQIVAGVDSQGDCVEFALYDRVTSATGPGGFITNFLNDTGPAHCGTACLQENLGRCYNDVNGVPFCEDVPTCCLSPTAVAVCPPAGYSSSNCCGGGPPPGTQCINTSAQFVCGETVCCAQACNAQGTCDSPTN